MGNCGNRNINFEINMKKSILKKIIIESSLEDRDNYILVS
jgi:hypothetical protein